MKYILCYDIQDDKRLRKVSKIMEAYGYRVQKSVFGAFLSVNDMEELDRRLKKTLNEKEDSVRIYRMCEACDKLVNIIGLGEKVEMKKYIIL